jgi:hypothetical protein
MMEVIYNQLVTVDSEFNLAIHGVREGHRLNRVNQNCMVRRLGCCTGRALQKEGETSQAVL